MVSQSRCKRRRVGKGALAPCPPFIHTAVILRCSPFFTATLEGWVANARDPSRTRAGAGVVLRFKNVVPPPDAFASASFARSCPHPEERPLGRVSKDQPQGRHGS